jgi:beta-galactosidase
MIGTKREAGDSNGRHKAFFQPCRKEYIKTFSLPEECQGKHIVFEFEGVYMNATVFINNEYAGQRPYGYSNFYIDAGNFLRGGENTLKVSIDTGDDSRWYTGAGIYRNVNIITGGDCRFALDGVKITTEDVADGLAIVEIKNTLVSDKPFPQSVKVITEILDEKGAVAARDEAPATLFTGEITVRQRVPVKNPQLWSPDEPHLYTCKSVLVDETGSELDEERTTFGIRKLVLDSARGLTLNGKTIKLRGACIHHDNGIIGSATFERAEERRVKIMKAAGFNALRSAHHPMSKAMLDACDRLGMLVMDEFSDMWVSGKNNDDYAKFFPKWWEEDIAAMVDKDYNHPSVILYSIGNEIPDTGGRNGARWGRLLAEKIRSMDRSRYIINSINGMVSVLDKIAAAMPAMQGEAKEINSMMADMGAMMKALQNSELVTKATEESYACVDVGGYNYMDSRYHSDAALYPNRIICGTETYAKDIAGNWKLVTENAHIIGDFTWTGWDYLGEAGIGKIAYGEGGGFTMLSGAYPWITAYCGDIDITGFRKPVSYWREIVWGLRKAPYIAVQKPEHYGEKMIASPWAWSDSVSSWTWPGFDGKPVKIEVYSSAEEVRLYLDGSLIGKAPAGKDHNFMAVFDTIYKPGKIEAVSYSGNKECGRFSLTSAGNAAAIRLEAERQTTKAGKGDLAYISMSLVDAMGTVNTVSDRKVTVTVEGSGVLQGFGSGAPVNGESYTCAEHSTFEGRALAVIRPTGSGAITVSVRADGLPEEQITVTVIEA